MGVVLDLPCDTPVVLGAIDVDIRVVGLSGVEKGGEGLLHPVFVPARQEKVGAAGQGFLDGKAFGVAGGRCPEAINDSSGYPHGKNLAEDADDQRAYEMGNGQILKAQRDDGVGNGPEAEEGQREIARRFTLVAANRIPRSINRARVVPGSKKLINSPVLKFHERKGSAKMHGRPDEDYLGAFVARGVRRRRAQMMIRSAAVR